jgi:uncharacterized repeat protein (TIGR01451 family)
MSDTLNNFTVTTDQDDYQPGDTAIFTASNVDPGSAVTFNVAHVTPGADGIYNTEDDQYTYDLTGTGLSWAIVDGGAGDLDGAVNGSVITSWTVNLDALNQAFMLFATDSNGDTASTFFTDANPVPPVPSSLADGTLIFAAEAPTNSTGSGVIDSFLRIQADTTEQGINTDGAVQFDTKSGAHTHHIFLADVPVVTIDGTEYREIRLDVNESGGGSAPLTLSRMQLWYASTPNLSNFDPNGNGGVGALPTGTLIWNMDSATNGGAATSIALSDWNSGSGKGDYAFYIPESFFSGIVGNPYLYVYGQFGATEGGFEEFYIVTQERPALTIDKTATVPGDADGTIDSIADDIQYTIVVTNTGNVALTGVVVTDKVESYSAANLGTPASHPAGVTVIATGAGDHTDAILDVGEVWTYTFTYNVVQADIDSAQDGDLDIDNVATVDTTQTDPVQDTAVVPVIEPDENPGTFSIHVTKAPNVSSVDEAGDVITYTILVTNTGTNPLTGIVVTDPLLGGTLYLAADTNKNGINDGAEIWATNGDANDDGKLDLTETWTYTATYTVKQSDIDNNGINSSGVADDDGDIDNTVKADSAETDEDTANAFVNIVRNPDYTIEKTVTSIVDEGGGDGGSTADEAGDVIHYSIVITNTGNVTLTGIVVTDPLLGGQLYLAGDTNTNGLNDNGEDWSANGDANNDGKLDTTEAWTYTATYTVQQQDLDDNGIDGSGAADDDGDIDNTATVSSNEADDESDSAEAPISYAPALTIDKVFEGVTGGNGNNVADAVGDVLNYHVTVTNTGNVTLTGVTVKDPLTGLDIVVPTLAPGASHTADDLTYVLTAADLAGAGNAGSDLDIDNTAKADSNQTDEVEDTETVPLGSYTIDKTVTSIKNPDASDGGASANQAGDVIHYQIVVTNTGVIALHNIVVTDPLLGGTIYLAADINTNNQNDGAENWATNGDANDNGVLDVGEAWTYTATYTVKQGDIDSNGINSSGVGDNDGDIDNTATVASDELDDKSDSASAPVTRAPGLAIDKVFEGVTGGNGNNIADAVGDVLNYSIKVSNTGNTTLTGVTVKDPLTQADVAVGTLAPGASHTVTGLTYVLTANDLAGAGNAGSDHDIDNTGTADSNETDEVTDTETVPLGSYTIDKTVESITNPDASNGGASVNQKDDVVHYKIVITNTGAIAIHNVVVTDPLLGGTIYLAADANTNNQNDGAENWATNGDTNDNGVLDVGESWTYRATYTVKQSDIDSNGINASGVADNDGDIDNTATVASDELDDKSDSASAPITRSPGLAIDKVFESVTGGNGNSVADAVGDVLNYHITVTNTGNVTLTGVTVKDPLTGLDTVVGTLAVGASATIDNLTYVLTAADLAGAGNAGPDHDIDNTGRADSNETNEVTDTETVPIVGLADILITKTSDIVSKGKHADKVGDVITFKIVVDNTGDVALHNVVVTDEVEDHIAVVLNSGNSTKTGDINNNGILEANEKWTYTYKYTLTQGDLFETGDDNRLYNTATASASELQGESVKIAVDLGPSVRTAFDWTSSVMRKFWDGVAGNEGNWVHNDGFPMSDITRPPYANPDTDLGLAGDQAGKVLDPISGTYKLGLLIGDWNLNGETDGSEQTLFYTPAEALAIMTASASTMTDGRYTLARELIGSWLNYQAGNPVLDLNEGIAGDKLDAEDVINWAIDWLQHTTPNEDASGLGDGSLTLQAPTWKVLKTAAPWLTGVDGPDGGTGVSGVSPMPFFDGNGDIPAGSTITSYLHEYNDEGTILGVHIALE